VPPGVRRAVLALLLAAGAAALAAACGGAPQVLEISPQRGAADVRSSEPVRVRFDRPMDTRSVAARFHVLPTVPGTIHWSGGGEELTFEHDPLSPSAQYQVVLDGGYRDVHGTTMSLRHAWTFRTEAPPVLTGAGPGQGDADVDPAAYITLSFSREMDLDSLRRSISLSPGAPFALRADPGDARRVVLAPETLLDSRQTYNLAVMEDARDVDGNRMDGGRLVTFTTGDFRPLRHWVGFIAESTPGAGGDGVWIVNENRFPRRLVTGPISAFAWSPDGSRVLLRSRAGTWTDQALDGPATPLSITAGWAGYLAPGRGYAFLDQGRLQVLQPDGQVVPVATGVTAAAVAPGGGRLAYVTTDPTQAERSYGLRAYDVDLRTRFVLGSEPAPVDGLAWSGDGQALAYRVDPGDPLRHQVRVRSLRDGGVVTVATGPVSAPVWQADGRHVFVTAPATGGSGTAPKAFRFAIDDSSAKTFTAAQGLPAGQRVAVDGLSTSADGHQLAFVADRNGLPGVWTMNADGTGLTSLTDNDPARFPFACSSVDWTPT